MLGHNANLNPRYIILATTNGIHVYEAENSLLVRTMKTHGTTCYALSPSKPQHLYVGSQYGDVHRFDWTTSKRLATTKAGKGATIRSLLPIQLGAEDEALFTIQSQTKSDRATRKQQKKDGTTQEKARDSLMLRKASADGIEERPHLLFQTGGRLQHLRALDEGRVIVIAGEEHMIVGSLSRNVELADSSFADVQRNYRWRRLNASHAITCLDTYSWTTTSHTKAARGRESMSYGIAVGNAKCEILVYDDVLEQLDKLESEGSGRPPNARVLRWHREAPNTVKWSKDGKADLRSRCTSTDFMQATTSYLAAMKQFYVSGS